MDHELCFGALVCISKNRVLGTFSVPPIFYCKIHENIYGIWVSGNDNDEISYICLIVESQSQTSLAFDSLETDGDTSYLPSGFICGSTFCAIIPWCGQKLHNSHTNRTPSLQTHTSPGLSWVGTGKCQVDCRSLLGFGFTGKRKGWWEQWCIIRSDKPNPALLSGKKRMDGGLKEWASCLWGPVSLLWPHSCFLHWKIQTQCKS